MRATSIHGSSNMVFLGDVAVIWATNRVWEGNIGPEARINSRADSPWQDSSREVHVQGSDVQPWVQPSTYAAALSGPIRHVASTIELSLCCVAETVMIDESYAALGGGFLAS